MWDKLRIAFGVIFFAVLAFLFFIDDSPSLPGNGYEKKKVLEREVNLFVSLLRLEMIPGSYKSGAANGKASVHVELIFSDGNKKNVGDVIDHEMMARGWSRILGGDCEKFLHNCVAYCRRGEYLSTSCLGEHGDAKKCFVDSSWSKHSPLCR